MDNYAQVISIDENEVSKEAKEAIEESDRMLERCCRILADDICDSATTITFDDEMLDGPRVQVEGELLTDEQMNEVDRVIRDYWRRRGEVRCESTIEIHGVLAPDDYVCPYCCDDDDKGQ